MGKLNAETRWITGSAFFAVAAAYAASYEIARYFSPSSLWNLMAGLRLGLLLVVPRRYWPALVVGEWAPLIQKCVINAEQFGMEWAILAGIPLMAVWMPLVMLAKRLAPLPLRHGELNIVVVLVVAVTGAFLGSLVNVVGLRAALEAFPGAWPDIHLRDAFLGYVIGDFCGAFPVVPAVFALKDAFIAGRNGAWRRMRRPALTGTLIVVCLAAWVAVAMVAPRVHGAELQALRLCTVVPVLALTLRFGWQGGAIGGVLALVSMVSTADPATDLSTIEAEAVFSLAMAGALLIGMPIARRKRARLARLLPRTAN